MECPSLISVDSLTRCAAGFGYASGVGAATREEPHRNLMNAKWWTDGLRVVIEVAEEPTPLEGIRFFYWDWSGATPEQAEEINRWLRSLKARP